MPVPQPDTATAVVSTGTSRGARVGIEGRSVLTSAGDVKLRCGEAGPDTLPLLGPVASVSDSMPSATANLEGFPGEGLFRVDLFRAILFAKFALRPSS
jgi:hypothetical protein